MVIFIPLKYTLGIPTCSCLWEARFPSMGFCLGSFARILGKFVKSSFFHGVLGSNGRKLPEISRIEYNDSKCI